MPVEKVVLATEDSRVTPELQAKVDAFPGTPAFKMVAQLFFLSGFFEASGDVTGNARKAYDHVANDLASEFNFPIDNLFAFCDLLTEIHFAANRIKLAPAPLH